MTTRCKWNSGFAMILLALFICLLAGCGGKSESNRHYTVGVLCELDFMATVFDGFKEGMTERGYIEGENITYEVHHANYEPEKERRVLEGFIARGVDAILTMGTEVSIQAKAVAEPAGVPLVFTVANIEGVDLVDNVRHPGGCTTGVRYPGPDIAARRFEIMLALFPHAKRILVPHQKGYPIIAPQMEILRQAAAEAEVELILCPVSGVEELRACLDARSEAAEIGVDAILLIAEPLGVMDAPFALLGEFADRHGLPLGGAQNSVGGHHSLFGVHIHNERVGLQAARITDQIFSGTPAGDIPVLSAESFFSFNHRQTSAFNLSVDEGILRMADEIIR